MLTVQFFNGIGSVATAAILLYIISHNWSEKSRIVKSFQYSYMAGLLLIGVHQLGSVAVSTLGLERYFPETQNETATIVLCSFPVVGILYALAQLLKMRTFRA